MLGLKNASAQPAFGLLCGFAALLFSGFPGLAQLGLYSLSGVAVAALVTRFILPPLAGDDHRMRDLSHFGPTLQRGIALLHGLRWPVVVLTLLAAGFLTVNRDHLWHPNLSALSTVSAEDSAIDMALRADIGAPDARYMAVITAPDQEAALQAADDDRGELDRGAQRAGQAVRARVQLGIAQGRGAGQHP